MVNKMIASDSSDGLLSISNYYILVICSWIYKFGLINSKFVIFFHQL